MPEGRIGGVIRQLRHRAEVARARAARIFVMLVAVILLGIGFYLGQPFFRLYVDGQRVALQQTLESTAVTASDLRKVMTAQAEAYADALRQSGTVIETPTEAGLWGHVAVGDDLLFYGSDGTLLRTGGDGTGGQIIQTPAGGAILGHVQVSKGLLFYGATLTNEARFRAFLMHTNSDGTEGKVVQIPTEERLFGHVAAGDIVLFFRRGRYAAAHGRRRDRRAGDRSADAGLA